MHNNKSPLGISYKKTTHNTARLLYLHEFLIQSSLAVTLCPSPRLIFKMKKQIENFFSSTFSTAAFLFFWALRNDDFIAQRVTDAERSQ